MITADSLQVYGVILNSGVCVFQNVTELCFTYEREGERERERER